MATIYLDLSFAGQELSGPEALEIRNAIEDQIEESGIGEVVGAGCAVDGSNCHLDIETDDPDAAEEFLRGLLEHVGLLEGSQLRRE